MAGDKTIPLNFLHAPLNALDKYSTMHSRIHGVHLWQSLRGHGNPFHFLTQPCGPNGILAPFAHENTTTYSAIHLHQPVRPYLYRSKNRTTFYEGARSTSTENFYARYPSPMNRPEIAVDHKKRRCWKARSRLICSFLKALPCD